MKKTFLLATLLSLLLIFFVACDSKDPPPVDTSKTETSAVISNPLVTKPASEGLEFTSNGDGSCVVAGIGTCTDTDIIIPSVYKGASVIAIGSFAFEDCISLTSVEIPDSVTSIDMYAFNDCTNLASVTFGDNSKLTAIGSSAFSGCTNLTSVTIPSGVTTIGELAFYLCTNLTSVEIPVSVTSICASAFAYTNLTNVIIPNGVNLIGNNAFEHCMNLNSIEISASVASIGDRVFFDCQSLVNVTFSADSRLTYIGEYAFFKCTNLTSVGPVGSGASVEIPNSVTTIDLATFVDCIGLQSVNLPSNITTLGACAFSGCTGLNRVSIGNGVTVIGNYTFQNCTSLTSLGSVGSGSSVEIPPSVISIGNSAFNNTGLKTVTLPSGVTAIDDYAFSYCMDLESIIIPKSVIHIGQSPFRIDLFDCSNPIINVYYEGTKNEWNNIEKGSDWGEEDYMIHYDDKEIVSDEGTYSIYVDDIYFIDTDKDYRYMVVEKYNYYQLLIKNNETGEILKYGTDGFTCESSNDSIISVGPTGTMVIHEVGGVDISLIQNGMVMDTMRVHGCIENSRITNYSATKDSELFKNGFAPNCRLKVFNYQSIFIADSSYEGGGYYKVTFDVYNDVPTYFCVGVFDKNEDLIEQRLINGYSDGMVSEMVGTFTHFGDWFNGNLLSGETEIGQAKTSIELKVPLGGYVDFLTINNSYYMVFANTLCGIVIGAMETSEDWVKLVEVASTDIDVDKFKFGEALVKKMAENLDVPTDVVIKKVIDLVVDKEDVAAFATDLMAFIWDSGITMDTLFTTLAECSKSELPSLRDEMIDGTIDLALTVIPPAKILKKFTDATISSLQYAIILKDVALMSTNDQDFLIIVYPTEQIP